jgi:hypothetical protein
LKIICEVYTACCKHKYSIEEMTYVHAKMHFSNMSNFKFCLYFFGKLFEQGTYGGKLQICYVFYVLMLGAHDC